MDPATALAASTFPAPARPAAPALDLDSALARGRYVYASPLRVDGVESTCHGRLWFAWLDGSVVVNTGALRWRARSVARGLSTRIWVGDHGSWEPVGHEAFRRGPSFDARGGIVRDEALLERMLAVFDAKYAGEIEGWRERIRQGVRDGSRVLIRYTPDLSGLRRDARPLA